jgi:hypothetical protein
VSGRPTFAAGAPTDGQDVTELVRAAERDGIETAPSTPTFESWLILHLVDHRAAIESGAKAEKILRKLLPGWDKGRTDFKDFGHGLKDACARAARLPEDADPSTGVHRLLGVILCD